MHVNQEFSPSKLDRWEATLTQSAKSPTTNVQTRTRHLLSQAQGARDGDELLTNGGELVRREKSTHNRGVSAELSTLPVL